VEGGGEGGGAEGVASLLSVRTVVDEGCWGGFGVGRKDC
jgi:hypothetical protein